MIDKTHRWKKTALAAATAVCCLWSSHAAALSLGRITVQSALGEPLRAEVDIPEINADEAASLKASVASPEAFRAAGLEYNPAMPTLQVTLQRRTDGRAYIRISGDKAINDPFVDMILEARWASGRIVRDYTLLFDPPRPRQGGPSTPTPAQTSPQALPPRPVTPQTTAPQSTASPVRPVPAQISPPAEIRKPAAAPAESRQAALEKAVQVSRGDTAGKIAANTKPANVSLDQMLVAMLRTNPGAFIGDNINRIKAGAVLNIPTEDQATATEAGEATRIIVAQSKDFNDFRRKLASSAPESPVDAAGRQVSGSVQAKVEEKKAPPPTPDKLTLTKGALQSKAAEDQLAAERSAKEASSRAAEIQRNISELSQLSAASSAAAPTPAASQAVALPPAPPASAAVAAAPVLPVSTPVTASAAPVPVPAPAPPRPAASAPPPPAAPAEPSLLDGLIEDPLVPVGALALIALLVGLGVYRMRQRKKSPQVDSAFHDSHLRQDSFFGVSGGQSVDTNDNLATGSSMMYSPSQLDAVDDVDPVAEADVYLAYGRDIQAEEILKDALLTNPSRLTIHHKLLEIYAKRRDALAFESIARQAFKASNGDAVEWQRICELGLSFDPTNALYQSGGEPGVTDSGASRQAALEGSALPLQSTAALAAGAAAVPAGGPVDLDLDLDFSMDDEPVSATSTSTSAASSQAPKDPEPMTEPEPEALDLDFGMKTQVFERPATAPVDTHSNAMEFTLPDLDINELASDNAAQKPLTASSLAPEPIVDRYSEEPVPPDTASDMGMLEFDLESLSLDLNAPDQPDAESAQQAEAHEDPLVTKLALAEEFRAIGDDDGARALIDEVIAEATGDVKARAQRALSNL